MPTWVWVIIAVAAAIAVAVAIAGYVARQNRTRRLQDRFGSEYDRTVSSRGEQRAAEEELAERERKREQLDLVPLAPEARDKYDEDLARRTDAFRRRPAGSRQRRRRAGDGRHEGARLSDRRLRAARSRHLGRPPRRGRELSRGARDLPRTAERWRRHGRPAPGVRPLSGALRGAPRRRASPLDQEAS